MINKKYSLHDEVFKSSNVLQYISHYSQSEIDNCKCSAFERVIVSLRMPLLHKPKPTVCQWLNLCLHDSCLLS